MLQFDLEVPRRDFSLKLQGKFEPGVTGVFGPSGAGKTSLFSLLSGLEKPKRGKIQLGEEVLLDTERNIHIPAHQRRIATVFQEKLLFPHMNVRENILFPTRYQKTKKTSPKDTQKLLEEICEILEINSLLSSQPKLLSGGEQQRVAIARAIMMNPKLLLLDEPFSALDHGIKDQILGYLGRVRDQWNITTLMISHDFHDIQKLASHVYYIHQGECSGFGLPSELWKSHPRLRKQGEYLNVLPIKPQQQESTVHWFKGTDNLMVRTGLIPKNTQRLYLPPEEVSLSLTPVTQISIQNQIEVVVKEILHREESSYLILEMVDQGEGSEIVSKITSTSVDSLSLSEGTRVWALFKAQALSC